MIRIEETPSPARAGRRVPASIVLLARQGLDPELAGVEAAGKVAAAGRTSWSARDRAAPARVPECRATRGCCAASPCRGCASRRRGRAARSIGVAGVEQHGAALLHVGVDARRAPSARRLRRARHDRPVDQRKEGQFVARDVEADRLAGLRARCAAPRNSVSPAEPGLADSVDLGVAGDDIGEPRLQRRLDAPRRRLCARRG